jgi:hypothetical protein
MSAPSGITSSARPPRSVTCCLIHLVATVTALADRVDARAISSVLEPRARRAHEGTVGAEAHPADRHHRRAAVPMRGDRRGEPRQVRPQPVDDVGPSTLPGDTTDAAHDPGDIGLAVPSHRHVDHGGVEQRPCTGLGVVADRDHQHVVARAQVGHEAVDERDHAASPVDRPHPARRARSASAQSGRGGRSLRPSIRRPVPLDACCS